MSTVIRRRSRTHLIFLAIVILLGALLIGSYTFSRSPDTLHIVVSAQTQYGSVHTILFDRVIHNASNAQNIYHSLLSLPQVPSGSVSNCGAGHSDYYRYDLQFQRLGITTMEGINDATGCAFWSVSGWFIVSTAVYRTNADFWNNLSHVTGAPMPTMTF